MATLSAPPLQAAAREAPAPRSTCHPSATKTPTPIPRYAHLSRIVYQGPPRSPRGDRHGRGSRDLPFIREGPPHYPVDEIFDLWYTRCPATGRGALRLTVYRTKLAPVTYQPLWLKQYSYALVERKASDSGEFSLPVVALEQYIFRIRIPSGARCQWWLYLSND